MLNHTLYDISFRIILDSKEKLLYQNKFKELDGFIYYKLSRALQIIFQEVHLRPILASHNKKIQLEFALVKNGSISISLSTLHIIWKSIIL